jgi:hypothetical protein
MADQGVQLGPILPTDLENVFETTVGDQDDARALPLQEAVGGDRGPVEKAVRASLSHQLPAPSQHGFGWILRGRRDLQGGENAVSQEEEVGKGTPCVDREDGG